MSRGKAWTKGKSIVLVEAFIELPGGLIRLIGQPLPTNLNCYAAEG